MIRVTIWNEYIQERGDVLGPELFPGDSEEHAAKRNQLRQNAEEIRRVHPRGIHETLKGFLSEDKELEIKTVTMEMPECGLTEDVLRDTDVLLWWAHVGHDQVPDEVAERVRGHVLCGMGFIPLHSAHLCKPMTKLLGTSCTLQWRDGDVCRVWNTSPGHPIAQGLPASFELDEEEMYGEFFDIPKPDEQVFISWFSGGEVFRSGCAWTRGYGRMFYFQPGHETNTAYHNPYVQRVIKNAVHWAAPTTRRETIDCPHAGISAEAKRLANK